jgi:hypothetical protein
MPSSNSNSKPKLPDAIVDKKQEIVVPKASPSEAASLKDIPVVALELPGRRLLSFY